MPRKKEKGQALILVLVALSIFLIGAIGFAIDGSHLYAQRQMAQAAADAAAQAAIMSIFDHTNNIGANAFTGTGHLDCSGNAGTTPCVYASRDGFSGAEVALDFLPSVPGVPAGSIDYPNPFAKASVTRTVPTTLMRFLGSTSSVVKAIAIAGIFEQLSPVPIIVTHPFLAGSFRIGGNPLIQICGGPQKSIQVNSYDPNSLNQGGTAQVDLHLAGPNDNQGGKGYCTSGTGGDFGAFGGPPSPGGPPAWLAPLGSNEHFLQPASPVNDPLAGVNPPSPKPAAHVANVKDGLANGANGCCPQCVDPSVKVTAKCTLYHPGLYTGGITVQNENAVFMPGVYWMDGGGFGNAANGVMMMSSGFANAADTGQGMLVYNTGTAASTGTFNVGANAGASLVGAVGSRYLNILFFQDRNSPGFAGPGPNKAHTLGGGGNMTLNGTIYLNNTTMTSNVYQDLELRGKSGNTTRIVGEIIVSTLDLGGGGTIVMTLDPNTVLPVNQVALVK